MRAFNILILLAFLSVVALETAAVTIYTDDGRVIEVPKGYKVVIVPVNTGTMIEVSVVQEWMPAEMACTTSWPDPSCTNEPTLTLGGAPDEQ